jgi:hypothetical protein
MVESRKFFRSVRAITLALVGALVASPSSAAVPQPDRVRLDRAAAPSMDDLIARLLRAFETKDAAAVRQLRVTRREYLKIIMPGFVEPGAQPRVVGKQESEFWWSVLDGKSLYTELALLNDLGGRRFTVKDVTFLKGVKSYAWYTTHGRILLTLADESGEERQLQMGSVVEANGAFKFVSYTRD